ncbi:MAG: glutamine amidotransferase [Saprospiraceae bacterium]|jgi:glutamine amidotransferase
MSSIAVLDLGTGNLHSVAKAVEFVAPDRDVVITHDPAQILAAERVVLPGQGAIGTWMNQVQQRDLLGVIEQVIESKPLLGICVGMQALFERSEEDGGIDSLGLILGKVHRFADNVVENSHVLTIPQMGWNQVWQGSDHPLWQDIDDGARFYFANSYYGLCQDKTQQAGTCHYGIEFTAAVAHSNVFAVQFHPEKSQQAGLQLFKNFINWHP